jgi:CxxC-x17-CxxC domain-containing protein
MEFYDKFLTCVQCGAEFVFSASGQKFFESQGFTEPKRCHSCRPKLDRDGRSKPEWKIVCSQCGKDDTVPFEPRTDRPIFCRNCFKERRTSRAA